MDHGFETVDLDGFVEGAFYGDVFYYLEGERGSRRGVRRLDLVCFGLAADGGDYGVPTFEEDIEDVGGDETATACSVVL